MKNKHKGIGSLLLAVTLMLTACGSSGGANTPNDSANSQSDKNNSASSESSEVKNSADEPVTLRMTIWGSSQMTVEKNDAVIQLFEDAHPGIKVEVENYAGDVYFEKLGIMAASNNLPDIIRMDYAQIQNYAKRGLLLPLEPYVESNTIDLRDIEPVYIDSGKIDNVLYGLNIGSNAPVMFYNPKLLEEAGVAAPTPDYTWEQYVKDMQTVHDKLGIYGDTHLGAQVFEVWLRQHDTKMYNEEQTGLGYEDDQLFVDFYNMQLDWQKEEIISTIGEELEIKGLEDGPFAKGKAAFGFGLGYWSNQADTFVEALNGQELGYAMYPGSGDGKGMYIKPSFFHSIAKNSKHPDEAAAFIEFYTNSVEAGRSLNGYFGIPYDPDAIAGMQDVLSDTQKQIIEYLETVKKYSSPIDKQNPPAHSEINKLLKNYSEQIYYKQITPEDAAAKFREQANSLLNQ